MSERDHNPFAPHDEVEDEPTKKAKPKPTVVKKVDAEPDAEV
jgi:hypothetical protein